MSANHRAANERARLTADAVVTSLSTYAAHFAAAVMALAAARGLVADERGALALMAVGGTFAQVLGGGGRPSAIAFAVAQRRTAAPALHRFALRTAMLRSLAATILAAAAGVAMIGFTTLEPVTVVCFLPWVFSTVFVTFAMLMAIGEDRLRAAAVHRINITVAPSLLAAAAVLVAHTATAAAAAYSIGTSFGLVIAVRELRNAASGESQADEPLPADAARSIRHYGRGAMLGTLTQQLNGRLDLLVVGLLMSTSEAGIYAVSLSIGQLVMPAFIALSVLAFRVVAMLTETASRTRTVRRIWVGAALAGTVIAAIGVPLVAPAMRVLLDDRYSAGEATARVLFVGVVVSGVTLVTNELLRGLGAPRRSSIGDGLGVIVMVCLIATLRPTHIVDVAWISTLAYAVGLGTASMLLGMQSWDSRKGPAISAIS